MAPFESSLLVAPAPDDSQLRTRGLILVPIAFSLVAVIAMASTAWLSTGLGGRLPSTLGILAVTLIACISAVEVARLAFSVPKLQRLIVAGLIVGIGLLLSAGSWSGTLLALKMKAYESNWQAAVDQAVHSTPPGEPACTTGYVDLPGIRRAYETCVVLPGAHNGLQVSFSPKSPGTTLLYMPDSADAQIQYDECLSHIDGPWWQSVVPDGNCPAGWTFIEGP